MATLKIQSAKIEPFWATPEILLFLRMRFSNIFLTYMVWKYQNEIAPTFYYGISTKTNEKDLKIPNLQPFDWKHPYWMSLYNSILCAGLYRASHRQLHQHVQASPHRKESSDKKVPRRRRDFHRDSSLQCPDNFTRRKQSIDSVCCVAPKSSRIHASLPLIGIRIHVLVMEEN